MHTALSYDISPITPSNSDIDFFLPKHIHQYCFLPSWWLSPSNQLAFILGYTGMQTAFSSHAMLFCKVQLVSLLRRQCATIRACNKWGTRGVWNLPQAKQKGHWSTGRLSMGSQALVCRQEKGAGRCPSYLISMSLLTSDYFIRFPLSASTPKLIYWELQSPFPRLLSASLFWLPSLFLFPTERDSLLNA